MKRVFPVFTNKRSSLLLALLLISTAALATPLQIYGAWHCGNDACTWGTVRDMTDFDAKNHWMIDRGDGVPSVNLVVLSFVNPLKLLNKTNDAQTVNGVPIGMNSQVVSYFTSHNVRVMLSIGGITFVSDWNTALSTNPTQLGLNAAALAKSLGVGIEIDYEENTTPNLTGMQAFITAYRSQLPYDATGANAAARLDHRRRRGRPLLDRPGPQSYQRLAHYREPGGRLCQCHGAEQAAAQRVFRGRQLAGACGRQIEFRSTHPATGAGQIYRQPVHHQRTQSSSGVYEFQFVAGRFNRKLRANRCAQRRRHNRRHAGLHVLGGGVSFHQKRLYHAAQYLPGRSGRRRKDLQHSSAHAAVATTIGAPGAPDDELVQKGKDLRNPDVMAGSA